MSFLVVIPARWQSSRFPGKPLADLEGKPVLEHVWNRCQQAVGADRVVIASDDERILTASRNFGARAILTSQSCLTGTDRVAEIAKEVQEDWYINVQGDEPFVEPEAIVKLVRELTISADDVAAINAMSKIANEEDFRKTSIPKVISTPAGRLLYISRAPIPTDKGSSFRQAFRQVGLYAFRRSALEIFASYGSKTPIEEIEDIEILRLLELGLHVQMIEIPNVGPAIDTPTDLETARIYLRNLSKQ